MVIDTAPAYVPRLVDSLIEEFFEQLPALMIVGPRAAGKTRTAERHANRIVRLERPTEAAAFVGDPDARRRDTRLLHRYLEAYALNSAGVADNRTIYEAAQVNKATATAYEDLLNDLLIAEQIPAF